MYIGDIQDLGSSNFGIKDKRSIIKLSEIKAYVAGFTLRGDSLIKVGTDVRAWASGTSGVNFCPGIRFLAIFNKKMCQNW